MKILKNKITNNIVEFSDNASPIDIENWVDVTNEPEGLTLILNKAKTAKIAEINKIRDKMDIMPFSRFKNDSAPAYEITVDQYGNITKTNNSVSFVFDASQTSIPLRTPNEILNDVKEEYDNGDTDYYLPYACDIIDEQGNFLRKGGIALDINVRNDIRNHLKNRAKINTFISRGLKNAVIEATSIEQVKAIQWKLNDNLSRFS